MRLKSVLAAFLLCLIMFGTANVCSAIQEVKPMQAKQQAIKAQDVSIAFVFDSDSDKTTEIIKTFRPVIEKSLLPEFKANFSDSLVFKGNWTKEGAKAAADKALNSKAKIILSFGSMTSDYLNSKPNKSKYVMNIDQYTINSVKDKCFNPIQQSVNDFVVFQRLVKNINKTAILMNENTYKMRNDWGAIFEKAAKDKGITNSYVVIPVSAKNLDSSLAKISDDVDSVYITQLYNLTTEQKKDVFNYLIERKLPSFSSMGCEDVQLGAMLGTSVPDADLKLAQATSFSIKNVLRGGVAKSEKVQMLDTNVICVNKDTAEAIGYPAHIRLLKSAHVITSKQPTEYNLAYVFKTFDEQNWEVLRKKQLVNAARRATYSAWMHYLPTLRLDMGYQTYNHDYAYSYQDVPTKAGVFTTALDQVLYSPDLVTNIIVKHKKLKFAKADQVLAQQTYGLNIALLYIDTLKLQNEVDIQTEYVKELQSNLAVSKMRLLYGKGTQAEVMRWTGEINKAEQNLLILTADLEVVKIKINQMLGKDQTEEFRLAPLTTKDDAFFMSSINLIDYIRTPEKIEKVAQLLSEEAVYLAPETTKLKAAIAMKKAELSNYGQKFFMPNAKLSVEHGKQFTRDLPYSDYLGNQLGTLRRYYGDGKNSPLDKSSTRFLIAAQWKPIEGGTKFAEIARCKSELNELNIHLEEVNTEIESLIRTIVSRAVARYLCIERAYKNMFAQEAGYQEVKAKYLSGELGIAQTIDALQSSYTAKVDAKNSQYAFFQELIWLQRGLASVNWVNASDDAKNFIEKVKTELEAEEDVNLTL